MKHLYYLESAKSVNIGDNGALIPIPAKVLKWKTRLPKMAWEDPERCLRARLNILPNLKYHVIRVVCAGWFKSLLIRISSWLSNDWMV